MEEKYGEEIHTSKREYGRTFEEVLGKPRFDAPGEEACVLQKPWNHHRDEERESERREKDAQKER